MSSVKNALDALRARVAMLEQRVEALEPKERAKSRSREIPTEEHEEDSHGR